YGAIGQETLLGFGISGRQACTNTACEFHRIGSAVLFGKRRDRPVLYFLIIECHGLCFAFSIESAMPLATISRHSCVEVLSACVSKWAASELRKPCISAVRFIERFNMRIPAGG